MNQPSGLKGKRVLVTAASRGIGFGAAKAFLQEGSRVVINSSNGANLSAAEKQLRGLGEVHGVVADHMAESDLDRLVDETKKLLGGIDVLAYVAGPPPAGTFMEKDYRDWRAAADLLMVAPAHLARRVAALMIDSGTRGNMVFVSSFTIREPVLNLATSNVARGSMLGLVRSLARELGPKGIRVNGVIPGYIDTDRLRKVIDDSAARTKVSREQATAETVAQIPLGRLGTAEEMAAVITFLASDRASYVSGATVPVDGAYLHSVG
ncbi:MAG: SDR family oxidoreductase [Nitrososphaerales archaeon]|nr:SDR family oxidoreductase [Nitrososphaerales archaeon]